LVWGLAVERRKGRNPIAQAKADSRIGKCGSSALRAYFGHCAPDNSAEPILVAYRGAQIAPLSRSGSHPVGQARRAAFQPSIRKTLQKKAAFEETGGGPLGGFSAAAPAENSHLTGGNREEAGKPAPMRNRSESKTVTT
jgi:hypothetical protein